MADSTAVAAVGATGSVTSLIINAFVGFSSGTKILLARFIGARDQEKIRHTADTAVLLSIICGLIVAALGWAFSPAILRITNCPESCFDGATLYLRIYFTAAPAILLYNFCSSILTAAGNTKSPLLYMLLGGGLNLVLNVILCLILPNKVLAVAIATVASQILGAVLTLSRLCSGKDAVRLRPLQLRWNNRAFGKILTQGLPIGLVSVLYPLANLQIQSALNSYGVAAIAGNSASITLEGINNAVHGNLATATGVFMGQNLGAQKHDRVKKSFFHGLWISALLSFVIGNFFFYTGRFWLDLILPGDTTAADYAMIRMSFILALQFVAAINNVLSHFLQSFGYAFLSSLNSMACVLGFRVVWMTFVYPRYQTFRCLISCFFVSWLLTLVTNISMAAVVYARYRKGRYKRL
jgi:putative MATE family efflux protein